MQSDYTMLDKDSGAGPRSPKPLDRPLIYRMQRFVLLFFVVTFWFLWSNVEWQYELFGDSFLEDGRSSQPPNPNFYNGTDWARAYHRGNLTNETIFIHKAFYDTRDKGGPRIKLLVTADCPGIQDRIEINVDGIPIGVETRTCTSDGSRYNDWPKMVLFVEWMKRLGVAKILFTVQSVSRDVQKVIDHYKHEGIVESHGWPLLPFNEKLDPNHGVYYAMDNLDTQHCAYWTKSKYTYIGDADDFIYLRNRSQSLFDFCEESRKSDRMMGGLAFKHYGFSMHPGFVPFPYGFDAFLRLQGLRSVTAFKNKRDPKTIFMSQHIKMAWIHYPRQYHHNRHTVEVPISKGIYLHARQDFDNNDDPNRFSYLKYFEDAEMEKGLAGLRQVFRDIFGSSEPEYRGRDSEVAMLNCKRRENATSGCRDNSVSCYPDMAYVDDWIYTAPTLATYYWIDFARLTSRIWFNPRPLSKYEVFRQYYPKIEAQRNLSYHGSNWDKSYYRFDIPNNAIFVHKAFYDLRDPAGPRIRVIVTATCAGIGDEIDILVDGAAIGVEWKTCTNSVKCPTNEGCPYWHYDIASRVYKDRVPDTIHVSRRNNRTAALQVVPLDRSPSKYSNTVSACIGPLYWANDWPRVILFVEYWKKLGIKKILFTPIVVSKTVQRVIDYYKKQGIVETHGWPLLPFNEKLDPNFGVYVVSDNLDTQHCAFWSSSRYTFVGDIDELLVIRNTSQSLHDYVAGVDKKKKDLGGLLFPHVALGLNPPLAKNPFNFNDYLKLDGLKKPILFANNRAPKSIFVTESVKIAWIHSPRAHFRGRRNHNVPAKEAIYLHARENFERDFVNKTMLFTDVQLFTESELENIRKAASEIFITGPPSYNVDKVLKEMDACRKKSLAKTRCRDQVVSCYAEMIKLDDWVFTEPTEESYYIPV
ncbi:unnamed protein product, partial [Mesorhabditis spiculigera]